MFGTKSRALIVLGRGQLPAELAVCRQAVGEASLGAEVYLPSGLGRTARWASLEPAPQPLRVLPWGSPGEGSATRHRRDRHGVPRAEGWSGDSLQFFCPAGLRPTSLRHRTLPPLLSAFAPCECTHSSWMDHPPPPTALIPSHSSVAPFCPIGSFIWLAPLCRLHSPPFSPRALPALSQTFVVLSLVCLTLCPPSLARPHLSHISLDASLPGRLPTARVIIHLLPCLQYGVVVTVTPLWAGDLGRDQ